MAVKNLKSLVLRGSAVLLVGKAGNPRLGSGSTAKPETPEIGISMRHPSHRYGQEFQPAMRPGHADYCRVDSLAVYGAGRLPSCASVLSPRGMRRTSGRITTLSWAVSTAAIPVVTRCLTGLAWCKPGSTTLPASA